MNCVQECHSVIILMKAPATSSQLKPLFVFLNILHHIVIFLIAINKHTPNSMICSERKDELLFVRFAQYVLQLLGDTSQQPKILNNLPIKFSGYFFFKRHKAPGPE